MAKTELAFNWYPMLGAVSILAACLTGIVAIAYPAWKAIKLDPLRPYGLFRMKDISFKSLPLALTAGTFYLPEANSLW